MEIPKQKVIELLKKEGRSEQARKIEQELPEKIDHELHTDLLEKHGVNPQELLSKL
ncbi:MAG: hypothetical protein ACJ76Z_05695 [Thermoleophilaceae bacterium]